MTTSDVGFPRLYTHRTTNRHTIMAAVAMTIGGHPSLISVVFSEDDTTMISVGKASWVGRLDGAFVGGTAVECTSDNRIDGPAVGPSVGSAVGLGVGLGVGSAVGLSVGLAVGSAVGSSVGLGVGSAVGSSVGVWVGLTDGRSVVGSSVGRGVGA